MKIIQVAALVSTASAFTTVPTMPGFTCVRSSTSVLSMSKGFGKEDVSKQPREKSEGQVDRETKAAKYDEIAAQGGQEYNIFVRQFGSEDTNWMPCGSIAVPRGAQVSDAVFANEDGLKAAITRTYPKLKGMEQEFEFGYNLKVYPDDPVEVAMKTKRSDGPSLGNWISNLLSPVDTSKIN